MKEATPDTKRLRKLGEELIRDYEGVQGDFAEAGHGILSLLDHIEGLEEIWRAAIAYRNYTYDSHHGLADDPASEWGDKLDGALAALERHHA